MLDVFLRYLLSIDITVPSMCHQVYRVEGIQGVTFSLGVRQHFVYQWVSNYMYIDILVL